MGHHCHRDEHQPDSSSRSRLRLALLLTAAFAFVEAAGGFLFNSLALLADSGHMLSDTVALGVALLAARVGRFKPDDSHTFGFRRGEVLAALFNGLLLWGMVVFIMYEAIHRFSEPKPVQGLGMVATAALGLLVNLAMVAVLYRDRHVTLNMRGAFLHVVSDALGSLGAVFAGVVVITSGLYWVDTLVSLFICVLILYSSWGLVRESVHVLMEAVPPNMDIRAIEDEIQALNGVCCVYDLHVWSITTNQVALSAHVVLEEPQPDSQELLAEIANMLSRTHGISHSTIQLETSHAMKPSLALTACREGTGCAVRPR